MLRNLTFSVAVQQAGKTKHVQSWTQALPSKPAPLALLHRLHCLFYINGSPRSYEHNTNNFPSQRLSTTCVRCQAKNLVIILDSSCTYSAWQLLTTSSLTPWCKPPSSLTWSPWFSSWNQPLPTPRLASPHTLVSSQEELLKTQVRKCHLFAQNPPLPSDLFQRNGFQGTMPSSPLYVSHFLLDPCAHSLQLTGFCPGLHTSHQ